jgi:hypothetical protein
VTVFGSFVGNVWLRVLPVDPDGGATATEKLPEQIVLLIGSTH